MGWGDLPSYGHPTIETPVIDRLVQGGQRWTNFYSAASLCTPSRAAMLTGRLPIRSGMGGFHEDRRNLFPTSSGGLPHSEVTIAEMLKEKGYATQALGKWHLGHLPRYLPPRHGFDSYLGIPYSNDMNAVGGWKLETFFKPPNIEYWDVPLIQDEEIIERPANQHTITRRYTERAVEFIRENKDQPFFLYFAQTMPHTPLFAAERFLGTSKRGLYGDVIAEIDWSIGEVISTLEELDVHENTFVIVASDNGPWLTMLQHGGTAGHLRDGKATTWDGGMRVPAIFYWPGVVEPGVISDLGSTLDFLPTIAGFTGANPPDDRKLDGYDLRPVLTEKKPSPRQEMFFYRLHEVYAARKGPFKAHFMTAAFFTSNSTREVHDPPLLFNMNVDPSEQYNIAADHPDVIEEIRAMVREHESTVEPVEHMLELYPEGAEDPDRPWKEGATE